MPIVNIRKHVPMNSKTALLTGATARLRSSENAAARMDD